MVDLLYVPKKVRNFMWGEPPVNPKEARLLFKIDCSVLVFCCLNYWVNYLDRTNLANAYVSGMAEDLKMKGNEYNIINSVFTVGYIIGMVPNNLILLKVPPRYWLSFCSFSWGLLTLGLYKVSNYRQICAIRFFQALFESSTFSGTHLILGSWYNAEDTINPATGLVQSSELTKRSAVFTSSGLLGSIFSSFMQAAIYNNMDGYRGLAGWRWLFIIDFLITIPISIYSLICFPDTPETCKSYFFTDEEIELARSRVKNPKMDKHFGLDVFKRVFGRWHWYLFSLLWVFGGENESFGSNSLFAIYLKHFNYSVDKRNHYPMGMYGVGIFATIGAALYVDHTGGRFHWHIAIFTAVSLLVAAIMILSNPLNHSVQFAAQYISGISYAGQASFFAWANLVVKDDLQERAIVLASMNMFSGAVNAWWSIVFYSVTTAPKYVKGCGAMIGTTIVTAIIGCVIRVLQLRDQKSKAATFDVELEAGSENEFDERAQSIEGVEKFDHTLSDDHVLNVKNSH